MISDDRDDFSTNSGYVSESEHKPLGIVAAGLCVLLFLGILAAPHGEAPTPVAATIAKPSPVVANLSAEEENRVCRAAVAAIMGHDPVIMKSSNIYGTGRTVTYRRPSDSTKWTNRCSIYGNSVEVDGLMKPASGIVEKLEFRLDKVSVTILHYIGSGEGGPMELEEQRYNI